MATGTGSPVRVWSMFATSKSNENETQGSRLGASPGTNDRDPAATVTGRYFSDQTPGDAHPVAHSVEVQDDLLDLCADLTGTVLPNPLARPKTFVGLVGEQPTPNESVQGSATSTSFFSKSRSTT